MSKSEKADGYHAVVAELNAGWRVIICAAGIQWVLQRRRSPKRMLTDDWEGRSFCRTSEALMRCAHEHAGEIEPAAMAILAALPPRIEESAGQRRLGALPTGCYKTPWNASGNCTGMVPIT